MILLCFVLKTLFFFCFSSCWLSLEGGLLYAFVGPAAVIVLVSLSNTQCVLTKFPLLKSTNIFVCQVSKLRALKQLHVTSEDFPLHSSVHMRAYTPGVSMTK